MKSASSPSWYGTRMRIVALALVLAAIHSARDSLAASPGLNLPAASALAAGHQVAQGQISFEHGYPHLAATIAQGMPGGLEFTAGGVFLHSRVSSLGAEYRYDSDELEAGLRWQFPTGRRPGYTLVPAAGYSSLSSVTESSAGDRQSGSSKRIWSELLLAVGAGGGFTLSAACRGLHDGFSRAELAAVILGFETGSLGQIILVADYGLKLDVPPGWSSPWAAGIRIPQKKTALTIYASNVFGPAHASSLTGTDFLFYNFRLTLLM